MGSGNMNHMPMSTEGVTLVARAGILVLLTGAAALFRALIGRGRRADLMMLGGTLGGISLGVAVSSLISSWIRTDVSVICAVLGIITGWTIAWFFARRMPHDAR
jgi:membrane associated rhomboid family serine protease